MSSGTRLEEKLTKPSPGCGRLRSAALLSMALISYALAWQDQCLANPTVGLVPSAGSLGRAEAVTATVTGSDALFYNPAGLAWSWFDVGLIGFESHVGRDVDKETSYDNEIEFAEDPLASYFSELNAQGQASERYILRGVDIALPYVALTSFASASQHQKRVGAEQYQGALQADVGVAAGFAVHWHKMSIGFSRVALVRSTIEAEISRSEVEAIDEALANNDDAFVESEIRRLADVRYGGTISDNFGFRYSWWKGNPSGVGLAVLNAGDAIFDDVAPFDNDDIRDAEEDLFEEAAAYAVEIGKPDPLRTMVNLGVNLGFGSPDSAFRGAVSLDVADIGGSTIPENQRIGGSYEIGLVMPNELARVFSWPLLHTHMLYYAARQEPPAGPGHWIHMGLLNLQAFGGVRANGYSVHGGRLGFHFGVDRLLSLLKIEFEGFVQKPFEDSEYQYQSGFRAKAGLTFIY